MFLAGLVVGALLAAGGLAGAVVGVGRRGVVVRLDGDAIGSYLADAVRDEVVAAVPAFLDRIRADLPTRVEREVEGSLKGFMLTVGDISVELPERLRLALEAQIARQVQDVLEKLLADVDPVDLADDLAGRARATVLADVARRLQQAMPSLEPIPGLAVPVLVDIR